MIKKVLAIKNPKKEKDVIYEIANELGLKLKKTECGRCLRDYVAVLKEQLGLIDNAADMSDFNTNGEWVYICKRPQSWHGYIIDQDTPTEVIEQFVKTHPVGYYKRIENNNNNQNNEE